MKNYTKIFGIDISQPILDIIELNAKGTKDLRQIANTPKSIEKWLLKLKDEPILCVLEATGCYGNWLLHYLKKYEIATQVLDPRRSNYFMQVLGITSKTDKMAALSLALIGQRLDLPLYEHKSEEMKARKQLLMGIEALSKQSKALKNQLHALSNQKIYKQEVVISLEKTLETVEAQKLVLEESLGSLEDDAYESQSQLIRSVVGIGERISSLLLIATGGLQYFKTANELVNFVGLVPQTHVSGKSVRLNKGISKQGNKTLRAALYMGARSAVQHNKSCKAFYERLKARGKPHKKAMVAVMHKLIRQIFGVFQSGLPFDNNHYLQFIQ